MKVWFLAATFILATLAVLAHGEKRVMPWMCLERCGRTTEMISKELDQVKANLDIIKAVAYEEFNLGEGCKLDRNNFTAVGAKLVSWGLETYPMISSFPYPPNFLDWMRQCFKNPEPFIKEAVAVASNEGFTGYNVDWEPTGPATSQDAADYATFMNQFSDAMHAAGKKLTMTYASWNPIWNLTLLGKTNVDKIMTMSTYTANFTTFHKKLSEAVYSGVSLSKLGIGLQDDTSTPIDATEIKLRCSMIRATGVEEIDIWQAPIPDYWLDPLRRFVKD